MSIRYEIEQWMNRVPKDAVREGGVQNWWGVVTAPFIRTRDWWTAEPEAPISWWSRLPEMMEFYRKMIVEAGEIVRAEYDPEIWRELHGNLSPEQLVARHGNKGGLKGFEWGKRYTASALIENMGSSMHFASVPIMMRVGKPGLYGTPESVVYAGAWEGNKPMLVVADEPWPPVMADVAMITSLEHHPNRKLGFRIVPEGDQEVWEGNMATMGANYEFTETRLGEMVGGDPNYRDAQIVEVCDLPGVAAQNQTFLEKLDRVAEYGSQTGRVGVMASMTPSQLISWANGTDSQRNFIGSSQIVAGAMLDFDGADLVARSIAPLFGLDRSQLAEQLIKYAGGSGVLHIDTGLVERGFLVG